MLQWIKNRWHDFTHSPAGWARTLAALIGIIVGVGIFTMYYAGFTSYFRQRPGHLQPVSRDERAVQRLAEGQSCRDAAGCNDCHALHDNLVLKYANKAENGFMHSLKFTLQNYPENIQIREHNWRVTEAACVYCHGNFVEQIKNDSNHRGETLSCIRCHDGVDI